MNGFRSLLATVGLAWTLLFAGCAAYSTWPPIEENSELAGTNWAPAARLASMAVQWAHDEDGAITQFDLPQGLPPAVYDRVAKMVDFDATPITTPDTGGVYVIQLRLRGMHSEADVIVPDPLDTWRMVTLTFEDKPFQPWRLIRSRPWAIAVSPPSPHLFLNEEVDVVIVEDEPTQ